MKPCIFCEKKSEVSVDETEHMFVLEDRYPVTPGHLLIIPKAHRLDFFELTPNEVDEMRVLLHRLKARILQDDTKVSGFNIGMNCGKTAGQTVFHCHVHLIPRREGDMADPTGGVRGVIPGKRGY